MEFHISRAIREKLKTDELLFSYTGNVVFANVTASRKLAAQLNQLHEAAPGSEASATGTVNAGALFAMGLIDELNHALIARYREEIDPAVHAEALRWFASKIGPENVEKLLLNFVQQFPTVDVFQGKLTPIQWLQGSTAGFPNREAALEELMLLWLTNINPAFQSFRELFDDKGLQLNTPYQNVTSKLPDYLSTRPLFSPEVGTLLDALTAPMLASPDSITGQLDYIRERWPKYLGENLSRVLLAIDVVREEDIAIWMRFNPPGPDQFRHGAPTWGSQGFIGDEYVGYDAEFGGEYVVGPDGVRRRRYATDYQAPLNEYEAFSADQAWMPNVVLIAKSTYVWLEQLSKKYGRHIHHLNHIPDEELKLLNERGITGLWLIGLWERSIASRTIKRLRGHGDAVASAYSLKEYNIAEDLGGTHAYSDLRDRAAAHGIRLASDMVPNHMGIDSPWVIEHPDWFISRPESPFPVYTFNGPDISPDSRVEIKIEDHYYDQTDAAVAFRVRYHQSGETRFVYHGNDGTTFAWNDTAQLDYSKAYVREHVMQVILHVARQFPIIRFDAAMVLAKRHVQRLWFPLPGAGGSIPSRAENAISQEAFDALMPNEFWREVVDRVAVEVPGTLLLAEAFWLLEGYFVRTLGMHRVYNSAFMNMLRDEENAKYRSYLKKTLEFDPDILKRYVNFMSNPDERTAIDQFGDGDKCFGCATLLSTLPGLPMFGHGQIEGFTERYGMEFKQAKMQEWENDDLMARHQRDIAPLLKNRRIFAESTNFVLYDFWTEHGVDENVFAYSNNFDGQRSLIVYNNRYGSTRGTIHSSVGFMDKGSGEMRQKQLQDGLALPNVPHIVFAYRDNSSGLEYLRRSNDFHNLGMSFDLRGYQYIVLLHWRELHSTAEQPWDRLCDALEGKGVHSVDDALQKLRLRPIHEAIRRAVSLGHLHCFSEVAEDDMTKALQNASARKSTSVGTAPYGAQKVPTEANLSDATMASPILSEAPSATPVHGSTARADLAARPLDHRLQSFLNDCLVCFDKIAEQLPYELREAHHGHPAAQPGAGSRQDSTAEHVQKQGDPREAFHVACESAIAAAIRLPRLEQTFSTAWPPAIRSVLPSNQPGVPQEKIWAPILGWIVVSSLPFAGKHADIFERLQLRSALAEAFSSMGIEGEQTWRAAARVRVLLNLADASFDWSNSAQFWHDNDVRWIAGLNESKGITYLNKEQFEELLCWIQLPALLKIAASTKPDPQAIHIIEARLSTQCRIAAEAGYNLDLYQRKFTNVQHYTVTQPVPVRPLNPSQRTKP